MLKVLLYGLATFMETGIGVWIFGQMFPKRSMETEKDKTVWKIILIILLYFTAYSFCESYLENNIETKKTILIILLVLVGICLIPDCVFRLKRIRNFQSVLFFVMIVVPKLGISGYFSGLFFSRLLCNFLCIRHLQKLH